MVLVGESQWMRWHIDITSFSLAADSHMTELMLLVSLLLTGYSGASTHEESSILLCIEARLVFVPIQFSGW